MATRVETVNTYDKSGQLVRQVVTTTEVPDGPPAAKTVVPLAKGGIVSGYRSGIATTRPGDPYTITINLPDGATEALARRIADAITRRDRERGA